MTELEQAILQAYEVANKLKGLPTRESLKNAYLYYNFDRQDVAAHFGISTQKLNRIKKKLLGDEKLPSRASYFRQWNEVKWYTGIFPQWAHIPRSDTKKGTSNYKSP